MRRFTMLVAGLLIINGSAAAQPSSLGISLSGGYRPMASYVCQPGPENKFSPEVQVESRFATFADQTLSANGGLYYAYWNDGVRVTSYRQLCSHGAIYSNRQHTAGIRLFIAGETGVLPVMVSTGIARQFSFSEYLAGENWGGLKGHDYHAVHTTAEVGLHVRISAGARLMVQAGVRRFIRIPSRRHIVGAFIEDAQGIYQVGVAYTLLQ